MTWIRITNPEELWRENVKAELQCDDEVVDKLIEIAERFLMLGMPVDLDHLVMILSGKRTRVVTLPDGRRIAP